MVREWCVGVREANDYGQGEGCWGEGVGFTGREGGGEHMKSTRRAHEEREGDAKKNKGVADCFARRASHEGHEAH